MKTLKVTLKQHTPLIHFQHDQDGATLRASEVKPKLDRFVLEKLGNGQYQKGVDIAKKNNWLVGKGEHSALDYKMKIVAEKIDKSIHLDSRLKKKYNERIRAKEFVYVADFPLLLSNMGGKKREDDLINLSYAKSVTLECIFFNKNDGKTGSEIDFGGLLTLIKKEIAVFFANNNWGQRKDKGFGSFTVEEIDGTKIIWDSKEMYNEGTQLLQYEVNNDGFQRIKNLFDVIDFYWKRLKSGINYTVRCIDDKGNVTRENIGWYEKSYLWIYLNKKKCTWEKRQVKTDLGLDCFRIATDPKIIPNSNPAFFARAHLGCPIDGFTYKIPQGKIAKDRNGNLLKYKEKIQEQEVKKNIVVDNDKDIKRIASPIIFKPVFFHKKQPDGKITDFVSIYILYDKETINALQNIEDAIFTFRKENDLKMKSRLPLFIRDKKDGKRFLLDYHDLICQYHRSFKYWKMIARNYNWENILGKREILLQQVKK